MDWGSYMYKIRKHNNFSGYTWSSIDGNIECTKKSETTKEQGNTKLEES